MPDTEVVTFRVTTDELDQIEAVKLALGARNRSSFVREIVMDSVKAFLADDEHDGAMEAYFEHKISSLREERQRQLDQELAEVERRLESQRQGQPDSAAVKSGSR